MLAGIQVCRQLIAAGVVPVLGADERAELVEAAPDLASLAVLGDDVMPDRLELVIVLAATARSSGRPRRCAATTCRCSASISDMSDSWPKASATTSRMP